MSIIIRETLIHPGKRKRGSFDGMDRVEDIERDRIGDRLGERFEMVERVPEGDMDRGIERSPPTLELEPIYRNLLHSPVNSRIHSPLQPYHHTALSPTPPPHAMDTSNVRFRPVPVTAPAEMTSTYGHPRLNWPVMGRMNK